MAQGNGRTSRKVTFLPAGLDRKASEQLVGILQARLVSLIDLGLTLKHIHWNVVGPHFIGVHTMLDPQAASVNEMIDQLAERITTLGGEPGRPAGHSRQAAQVGRLQAWAATSWARTSARSIRCTSA